VKFSLWYDQYSFYVKWLRDKHHVAARGVLPPGEKVRGAAPQTDNTHPQGTEYITNKYKLTLTHGVIWSRVPVSHPGDRHWQS